MKLKVFIALLSLTTMLSAPSLDASATGGSSNKYISLLEQNKSTLKTYLENTLHEFAKALMDVEDKHQGKPQEIKEGSAPIMRDFNSFLAALEEEKDSGTVIEVFDDVLKAKNLNNHAHALSDELVMATRGGQFENQFLMEIANFKLKVEEIHGKKSLQSLTESTVTEMGAKGTIDVSTEFTGLKIDSFIQSAAGSACVLYSFLYAVHQTPRLLTQLERDVLSNIKESSDKSSYFINHGNKVEVFAHDTLSKLSPSMHPSPSNLLKVIGIYVLEKMGSQTAGEYFLANPSTGRDFFFNNPVLNLKDDVGTDYHVEAEGAVSLKNGEFAYMNDGTIHYMKGGKLGIISGDFVVSTGSQSHAVSVFFNHSENKWKLFDNLSGVSDLKVGAVRLNPRAVHQVLIIGDFKNTIS